jgi:tripartite-type tricarboxylate transporter receptor subunit TctC
MHYRRLTRLLVAIVLATLWTSVSFAQEFPSKVVRLIVPYGPGGPVDILARILGERMAPKLGKPVIIETKPGANTLVGTRVVLEAPADGHTLFLETSSVASNLLLVKDPGYVLDDFVPIVAVGALPIVFVVSSSLPVKTIPEFVKYLKDRPGKTNYATTGSFTELLSDRFTSVAGVKMVAVPYKGSNEALVAVVSDDVQTFSSGISSALPMIKSGKLRPLAVASEQRSALLPDIPTFKEIGYPDMLGATWMVVSVRAKTPPSAIDKLRQVLVEIVNSEDYRTKITNIGIDVWATKPEELQAFIKNDLSLSEKDVKRMGRKPE